MTIRDIYKIKKFLPNDMLCGVVCSLVLMKLDYCNALLYNLNNNEINMLQAVQNAAIRLISGGHKFDRIPISPLFERYHWLRIRERVVFKLCLIVHKCVWGFAPDSLREKIVVSNPRTFNLVEREFTSVFGQRAFSRAGPKLWNCLPIKMRLEQDTSKFKKLLKSFLMTGANLLYHRINMRWFGVSEYLFSII